MSLVHELLKENPNITVSVKLGDLQEWHKSILGDVSVIAKEKAMSDDEVLLTTEDVCVKLKRNPATLWRWAKRGYLVPIKVGGENRYKKSDINKILNGNSANDSLI